MILVKFVQLSFTIAILNLISSKGDCSPLSGYTEPCDYYRTCESSLWLRCDSHTRTCLCLDELTYDPLTEKCVLKIGGHCALKSDKGIHSSSPQLADCSGNSECTNGMCVCPFGTTPSSDLSSCLPTNDINENCSEDSGCIKDYGLVCVNGKCVCDPKNSVYNFADFNVPVTEGMSLITRILLDDDTSSSSWSGLPTKTIPAGVCLSKVNATCSYYRHCVRNSECHFEKCACKSPDESPRSGRCISSIKHNEECIEFTSSAGKVPKSFCLDNLVCMSAEQHIVRGYRLTPTTKCSCPDLLSQEYDWTTKTCRSRVGSPCNPHEVHSCTKRSNCKYVGKGQHVCACDKGYIPDDQFKCQLEYGQPCRFTPGPKSDEDHCDTLSGLECRNGICSCPNSYHVYDEERRLCVTPVGLSCSKFDRCVSNATCTARKHEVKDLIIPGKCKCVPGYTLIGVRCILDEETRSAPVW